MFDRMRHRLLTALSDKVTGHPYIVFLTALVLMAASLWITIIGIHVGPIALGPLGFQSDRNDLLSRDISWNQHFINWWSTFEGMNDMIVVVDAWGEDGVAEPGDDERARALVDDLGPALASLPLTREVIWRFDSATEVHPGALRMADYDAFVAQLAVMREAEDVLRSATPGELFARLASPARFGPGAQADAQGEELGDQLAGFVRMLDAMTAVIASPRDEPVDFATMIAGEEDRWQYMASENGRHYYIRVVPVLEGGVISAAEDAISAVRQTMAEVGQRHPNVEMGLTGVEVVEADETRIATLDSARASAIAVVVITALLIIAFHSWRVPLMAMIALLIGVAWSFGFVTLTVGHLQVLSVVFAVILLGLGIAFGIHLSSRYELLRHNYSDDTAGFRQAMRDTFRSVGPGMITAAITTAAAFATGIFTDFQGLAEMGAIAAGGILICLVAMLTVFPALLRRYKRRHHHIVPLERRRVQVFRERWIMPFARHPRYTLTGIVLVTVLALLGARNIQFDYNLLNLVPQGVESVEWQQRLVEDGGRTLWFGVSVVDDLETAEQFAEQYLQLPTVGSLGGVGLLFPERDAEKRQLVAQVRGELEPALSAAKEGARPPGAAAPTQGQPDVAEQLGSLRALLALAPQQMQQQLQPISTRIDNLIITANALEPQERAARMARLDAEYAAWRQQTARQIDAALTDQPLTMEAIPAPFRGLYHSEQRGLYALEIYPQLPPDAEMLARYPQLPPDLTDPLHPEFLRAFVEEMATVDPAITGASPQFYYSGELIWSAYTMAGLYALIVVFILVLIDFSSLTDAVTSLVPVIIGFIWTLGIMYVAGIDLNPANIIILPLMFGIGVDSGVHILHRYRQDRITRPLGLTSGTGKGITLTSLTAMIGFASMIPAQHRGVQSLGLVLTLGLGMILLACWVLMPAWLELREQWRKPRTQLP